jgi:endoglucanase
MKNKTNFLKPIELFLNKGSLAIILFVIFVKTSLFAQLPTAQQIASQMKVGWNLVNTLEVPNSSLDAETYWGNPKVNQTLITAVCNAGFNTIRIPCAWDSHANQSTLQIDTNWLHRVRQVVDYCYSNNMYVIINCHWDNGWLENNVTEAKKDTNNKKQKVYWTQIANYFKEYDEHLLFAGSNEPNVDNATQMAILMTYHQSFIDAVRSTGGNNSSRVLVIQGPSTDIDKTNNLMSTMPIDSIKDRLMVEIHYYTPWNFCGLTSDASWGKMFYFWGKNYHSATNTIRNATWGEESAVESYFQSMKTKFVDKGIPIIVGEYGAIKRTSLTGSDLTLHIASWEYYFQYITNAAKRYGMVPFCWENNIFNRNNGAITDQGLLNAIVHGGSTSVEEHPGLGDNSTIPMEFSLSQNYPNPFNPSTIITFTLPEKSFVTLKVYDTLGREISTLYSGVTPPGTYTRQWNAEGMPSGTYFYRLQAGSYIETKKITLIK